MKGKTLLRTVFTASSATCLFLFLMVPQAIAGQTVPLKAGPDMHGAQGQALIRSIDAGQTEVIITAEGLKPNEVYTVWLVNMTPKMDMAGLGTGDYAFTSDALGNGTYTSYVSRADLDNWQLLEIAHHPDGNPRNMKIMGIALKGDLN